MTAAHYDAIILGSGQGGNPLATALAEAGWKTAIIERSAVGGSCVNYGCIPSKSMWSSARVARLARGGEDLGVQTGPVTVDMARVVARKAEIVHRYQDGLRERLLGTANLDLVRGEARFVGPRTVEVLTESPEPKRMTADTMVIDVGSSPATPPIPGLDETPHLDSRGIMKLDYLPEHLVVLGGGFIGLEFGQMFRRFGSEVTIVERAGQILPVEDPDVAAELFRILEGEGIRILVGAEATEISPDREGVQVRARMGDGERCISGSHLLIALGRAPNTVGLGLDKAGVEVNDAGNIEVNENLETSAAGVYAVGDVTGAPKLTHLSYDDYRTVRARLLGGTHQDRRHRLVPYAVYTDPELGRVGLTERQARAAGHDVRVASLPMSAVVRAVEANETSGMIKVVVDGSSERILGAAVLAMDGAELVSLIQVAMMGDLPFSALRDGVFIHPSLAEALNNLFQSLSDG